MRGESLTAVLAALLLIYQPLPGLSISPAIGRLDSKGTVRVNGVAAPTGTTVHAGNQIDTGPGGIAAVMLSDGGQLVLGSSTSAVVSVGHGFLIRLAKGALGAVTPPKVPFIVEIRGITVRPKNREGTYTVVVERDTLSISAIQGDALVQGPEKIVDVRPGTTLKATLAPATEGKKRNHLKALLILSGVGAAAAIALATRNLSGAHTRTCVSPSQLNCP